MMPQVATLVVGGATDTEIWFFNCFLIISIKTAESNRWVKEKKVPGGRGRKERGVCVLARLWKEERESCKAWWRPPPPAEF